jgi:hypothetical protein
VTNLHVTALGALVVGCTGVVSMVAYRAALRCVDIQLLPGRIVVRAVWWRDHVGSVLGASSILVIVGLIGLVSG